MKTYLIIFPYYAFFCSGLFYLIWTRIPINSHKNFSRGESVKLKNNLAFKFSILAEKIGKIFSNIFGSKYKKKIMDNLEDFDGNKKAVINLDAFLGFKIIAGVILVIVFNIFISSTILSIFLSILGSIAGFFIPDILLGRLSKKRLEELNNDLPYIIDLLYIETLSGQNIYNSIKILIEKYNGSICWELQKFLKDVDFGIGKSAAYQNLISRNNTENFKSLLFLLMNAEKYGSSISDVLCQKSKNMKFLINQDMERKARKITLFMLFPLVFLILPSFILLVGGPLVFSVGGNFIFS